MNDLGQPETTVPSSQDSLRRRAGLEDDFEAAACDGADSDAAHLLHEQDVTWSCQRYFNIGDPLVHLRSSSILNYQTLKRLYMSQ